MILAGPTWFLVSDNLVLKGFQKDRPILLRYSGSPVSEARSGAVMAGGVVSEATAVKERSSRVKSFPPPAVFRSMILSVAFPGDKVTVWRNGVHTPLTAGRPKV